MRGSAALQHWACLEMLGFFPVLFNSDTQPDPAPPSSAWQAAAVGEGCRQGCQPPASPGSALKRPSQALGLGSALFPASPPLLGGPDPQPSSEEGTGRRCARGTGQGGLGGRRGEPHTGALSRRHAESSPPPSSEIARREPLSTPYLFFHCFPRRHPQCTSIFLNQ